MVIEIIFSVWNKDLKFFKIFWLFIILLYSNSTNIILVYICIKSVVCKEKSEKLFIL